MNIAELSEIPDMDIEASRVEPSDVSSDQNADLYREKYDLTAKEAEVLKGLIFTEENLQELADDMGISRRVLQKYITSIYEKTSTKTRVGLLQSYLEFLALKA